MIEGGKLPGQTGGFPTPTATPDETACRTFGIPASAEWLSVFMGALDALRNPYNWMESIDGISADEAAEAFAQILDAAYGEVGSCEVVPAPWWDEESGDDSDDEMPKDDQPWYGQLVLVDDRLTFVENAFIYIVAGFIAYAGLPSAAIQFIPLARTFVVTMKTNPLGGIVRFLADGVEIGRTDTYSLTDGTADVSIIMPAPTGGFRAEDTPTYPTLWLELLEDNPHDLESVSMTLIRSRLSESAVTGDPKKIRFDTETGDVQTSPDGGVTWVDNPEADPRYGTSYTKPPLGTGTAQCDSAADRVKWIKDFIDALVAAMATAGTAFTLANVALGFYELLFAEAGVIVDLLIKL